MQKSAVIYDKWLSSLGGGEVVACNIAKILADLNYDVTFIAGKTVEKEVIKNKLNIDLSKVSFGEIWTDESKVKQLSKGKDLFINTSFIDYTYGCAKKNIYYTHFPKEPYNTIWEMLFTNFLLPFFTKFINPIEIISDLEVTTVKNNEPAYLLKEKNRIAISYLEKNKNQIVEFSLFLSYFTQSLINSLRIDFKEANIVNKEFYVDHHHNQINFRYIIKPVSITAYLEIEVMRSKLPAKEDQIFLLYPKTRVRSVYEPLFRAVYNKVNNKLRAGIFSNPLERLKSYQVILANSSFTQKWIKNYWKRESIVVYPPVELLFEKYRIDHSKKKKWICSVGRFFTLGHGKKQEVLIKAFKKFYDMGYRDWQLHLVGGVGSEPGSVEIISQLKKESKGYPVFFHLNVSRKEVEDVYFNSQIYWHATGYGENESVHPIKFEHFGIAPIEAISAGCIPILYSGGGLKEIIKTIGLPEGVHLFKTIDHLVENTISIIKLDVMSFDWKTVFQVLSKTYSLEAFKKKILEVIN